MISNGFQVPLAEMAGGLFLFCLNSNALILNLKGVFKELGIDHIVLT